jgi:hypothetical protein
MQDRQSEKSRKIKQIKETEDIEREALKLRGKENSLKKQTGSVHDAEYNIEHEIKKLRS